MQTQPHTSQLEVTRRNLMKKGALGLLGATAAATAASVLTASPASGDDGDPIILGQENLADSPTRITVRDSFDTMDIFPGTGSVLSVDRGFGGQPTVSVSNLSGTALSASGEVNGVLAGGYTGLGVSGISALGIGVKGTTDVGTAIRAEVTQLVEGTAFEAVGPVKFSTAGLANVAGTDSVTVHPDVPITSTSKVLALLNGDPGNKAAVAWVGADAATNTFQIVMTKPPIRAVQVAWFLIS